MSSLSEKLESLYKSQDTLPKFIEDDSVPTQKMDEYYVELNMIMDNEGVRQYVKVSQIFDQIIVGDNTKAERADKILIIGRAGVGKSTFLHHISYEWGNNKIYLDKFDHIFEVKFKKLASNDVVAALLTLSKTVRLAKLLALSLDDQIRELEEGLKNKNITEMQILLTFLGMRMNQCKDLINDGISREEIQLALIENPSRTLLLLDGYDEIVHLNHKGNLVYEIMLKILDYNLVMTSRPNALSSSMETNFNRKIEISGLDQNEAKEYIINFFDNQQKIIEDRIGSFFDNMVDVEPDKIKINIENFLKKNEDKSTLNHLKEIFKELNPTGEQQILTTIKKYFSEIKNNLNEMILENPTLREVVSTPINTAMICLISSDAEARKRLCGDFNTGLLYQESMLWLGKRYTQKYEDARIFNVDHLSLQEYLTAFELRGKLMSNDQEQYTVAAEFIANHRNEPKYLMILRFLAGLVTTTAEGDEQSQLLLVHRFWEAVTCNVDGVLELGAEGKVVLLMNLLSQANRDNEIDRRIPNRDKIIDFIDSIVLEDIFVWEDTLKSSGYLSLRTRRTIWEMLKGNLNAPGEALALIHESGTRSRPLEPSIDRDEDRVVGDDGSSGITDLDHPGRSSVIVQESRESVNMSDVVVMNQDDVLPDLAKEELNQSYSLSNDEIVTTKQVISMVTSFAGKLAVGSKGGAERVFNKIVDRYLSKESSCNPWQIKKLALISLGEVLKVTDDISTEVIVKTTKEILDYLSQDNLMEVIGNLIYTFIGYDSVVTSAAIESLSSDTRTATRAAKAFGQVASGGKLEAEVATRTIEALLLLLSSSDTSTVTSAAKAIGQVASGGGEVATRAIKALLPLLSSSDTSTATNAAKAIGQVASKGKLEAVVAKTAIKALLLLLSSSDTSTVTSAAKAIGQVASKGKLEAVVATRVMEALLLLLSSSDTSTVTSAAKAIGQVASEGKLEAEVATRVMEALLPLLSSSNTSTATKAKSAVSNLLQVSGLDFIICSIEKLGENQRNRNIITNELIDKLSLLYKSCDKFYGTSEEIVPKEDQVNFIIQRIQQMIQLMNILSKSDEEENIGREIAMKILEYTLQLINDNNEGGIIFELNSGFDELVQCKLSFTETKRFMSEIYRKCLIDGEIDENDAKFIINCITHFGLTSTVTIPTEEKQFTILYEKDVYTLKGDNSIKYLRDITRAALSSHMSGNGADQNVSHKPLFMNNGSGIRESASDIASVVSVVDGKQIDHERFHVSVMHLSDHNKSKPCRSLLLLERRNEFGYYELHTLEAKVSGANYGVTVQPPVTIYPKDIDTGFRKRIFGVMKYDTVIGYKPRYYGISLELDIDTGFELIQYIADNSFALIEYLNTTNQTPDAYHMLHKYMFPEWSEYVDQALEYKKEQLLDLSDKSEDLAIRWEAELTRPDSWQIEINDFRSIMDELRGRLTHIDFDYLRSILDREALNQQQLKILDGICGNAYQYSFYQTLLVQLNAMYIATSSINSQLIDSNSSSQDTTGQIGGFLQLVSSHVPMVGVGVLMIGAIMAQLDEIDQAASITRYATIVTSGGDMAKLARAIAIALAPRAEDLIIPEGFSSILSQAMELLAKAVSVPASTVVLPVPVRTLDTNTVIGSLDLVSLVANAISGLKERIHEVNKAARQDATSTSASSSQDKVKAYAERLLFGVPQREEDKEESEGQSKGMEVAAFIINKIFKGEITEVDSRNVEASIEDIFNTIDQLLASPPSRTTDARTLQRSPLIESIIIADEQCKVSASFASDPIIGVADRSSQEVHASTATYLEGDLLQYEIMKDDEVYPGKCCTVYEGKFGDFRLAFKVYDNLIVQKDKTENENLDPITDEEKEMILKELQDTKNIVCDHLVRIYDVLFESVFKNAVLASELPFNSLYYILHFYYPLPMDAELDSTLKLRIIRDLISGVHYLHDKNIIHKDINTTNILLFQTTTTNKVVAKLGGFGVMRYLEKLAIDKVSSNCLDKLTMENLAPELLESLFEVGYIQKYTKESDIYALGITINEIMSGRPPYPHADSYEYFKNEVLLQRKRPNIFISNSSDAENSCRDIISSESENHCLAQDSNLRPSIDSIVLRIANFEAEPSTLSENIVKVPKEETEVKIRSSGVGTNYCIQSVLEVMINEDDNKGTLFVDYDNDHFEGEDLFLLAKSLRFEDGRKDPEAATEKAYTFIHDHLQDATKDMNLSVKDFSAYVINSRYQLKEDSLGYYAYDTNKYSSGGSSEPTEDDRLRGIELYFIADRFRDYNRKSEVVYQLINTELGESIKKIYRCRQEINKAYKLSEAVEEIINTHSAFYGNNYDKGVADREVIS